MQAAISVTPLVVKAVVVSLRPTDWRRNQVPRLLNMTVPYDLGEPEQSRAEAQPRALGRIHVDREAHPSAFDVELDDAARLREALAVADGQNRQRLDPSSPPADRRVSASAMNSRWQARHVALS